VEDKEELVGRELGLSRRVEAGAGEGEVSEDILNSGRRQLAGPRGQLEQTRTSGRAMSRGQPWLLTAAAGLDSCDSGSALDEARTTRLAIQWPVGSNSGDVFVCGLARGGMRVRAKLPTLSRAKRDLRQGQGKKLGVCLQRRWCTIGGPSVANWAVAAGAFDSSSEMSKVTGRLGTWLLKGAWLLAPFAWRTGWDGKALACLLQELWP
jgi:hypothetical protein